MIIVWQELREVCAALAAAREQRNQAAREAEVCRVSASEAGDECAIDTIGPRREEPRLGPASAGAGARA